MRRMVLDGAVAPTLTPAESLREVLDAEDDALSEFALACVEEEDPCPLGATDSAVRDRLESWLADLDRGPQSVRGRANGVTEVYEDEILAVLDEALSDSGLWVDVWGALGSTIEGDASGLDDLPPLSDGGGAASAARSGDSGAIVDGVHLAVICSDGPALSVDEAKDATQGHGFLATYIAAGFVSCTGWPNPEDIPSPTVSASVDVLIITNSLDTRTPTAQAQALMDLFTEPAALSVDIVAHTVLFGYVECADDAALAFLLRGARPSAFAGCSA